MPEPLLTLEPVLVPVEPGGQARAVLTIANPGTIVEGYRLRVVDETSGGPAGPGSVGSWCQILPPEGSEVTSDGSVVVSVYPQAQQAVVLVFAPPAGAGVPSGRSAFGVHAVSVVDPASTAVVEGDVDVGRVFGLSARIAPVTSTGRWRGRHAVTVSNWGNSSAQLTLVPGDPDQALGYLLRPAAVDLPVGGTAIARLTVRTRRPTLRGQPARLPFTVVAEPAARPEAPPGPPTAPVSTPERPIVDGAFRQKPILSRAVVGSAALMLVLAAGGAALAWRNTPPERAVTAVPGIPMTPVLGPAVARGPTQVMLSWAPVPDVTGYALQSLDPVSRAVVSSTDLDAALGAHIAEDLDPGTEYCFQLVARRGDVSSPPSAPECATTAPEPTPTTVPPNGGTTTTPDPGSTSAPTTSATSPGPTPTNPGGPGFTAGQSIAMVYLRPLASPGAREQAAALQQQLAGRGADAKVLVSTDYPLIRPALRNPAAVVYLGPFETPAEAAAACQQVRDDQPPPEDCLVAQPVP